MLKNKKILIISPHPDDEAIGSGGLIMRAKQEGAKVHVLYMATGQSRQFMNGETKEEDRITEIEKAAEIGDFSWGIKFQGKSTIVDTIPQKDLIEVIEDFIKLWKPNIVVIPYRQSYNQDHRAVASAAVTAFRPIPQSLHHQPEMILESEEPYSWPTAFSPNFYVDITGIFEAKIALYNCHASQVPLDPFSRSIANLERLAGFRGCAIGVKYAEAYNLLKGQL